MSQRFSTYFGGLCSLLFSLLISFDASAQSWHCGSDNHNQQLEQLHPELKYHKILYESIYQTDILQQHNKKKRQASVLPVVFHVIHNNGPENIPDNRIIQALDWLNASFENSSPYNAGGFNTGISFCLANQSPDGAITNGINRRVSSLTRLNKDVEDQNLKDLIRWETKDYINIWIVDQISSNNGNNTVGYANLPGGHGSSYDGIVIEANAIGLNKSSNIVLTHEMGHYLGLYHTFEQGCLNDDCLAQGDRVCDTPPDQVNHEGSCSVPVNSCMTDSDSGFSSDQDDLDDNFMDYNTVSCINYFTKGQSDRMNFFIDNARNSLLNSRACQMPCISMITLDVILDNNQPQVNESVQIINNSTNASTWEWYLNGNLESASENPSFVFDAPGIQELIVFAYGDDVNCFAFDTIIVSVICEASAAFGPLLTDCIDIDQEIEFVYSGPASTNIQWYLNDEYLSSEISIVPEFLPGVNFLQLIAGNEFCETQSSQYIYVSCNEICGNGFDDDSDGLIDCFDNDCCDQCPEYYFDSCQSDLSCNEEMVLSVKQTWQSGFQVDTGAQPVVGDIDNDGETDIIMLSQAGRFTQFDKDGNFIRYIGFSVPGNYRSQPIIADIDKDGFGEIITITSDEEVACIEHTGAIKYITSYTVAEPCCLGYLGAQCQVADLNYDGEFEVVVGNIVLNGLTGELIVNGELLGLSSGKLANGEEKHSMNITIANILPDNDPRYTPGLEIITGNQILDVDVDNQLISVAVEQQDIEDNFGVAIDYDHDGDLDVYTAHNNSVIVWEGQTDEILLSVSVADRILTLPTICNLDEDDALESAICVGNENFQPGKVMAFDNDLSVMWQTPIEVFSNCLPISFDFDDNGINEVIHRSDDNLRILNGMTGEELFIDICHAGTRMEYPIIADIDGDGHAELITACNADPNSTSFRGHLRMYEGDATEWALTRPVWNALSFYNTQIEDDLSLPLRLQATHLPSLSPKVHTYLNAITISEEDHHYDLSMENITISRDCDSSMPVTIEFDIRNNGYKSIDYRPIETVYYQLPNDPDSYIIKKVSGAVAEEIKGFESLHRTISFDVAEVPADFTGQICIMINDVGDIAPPFSFPVVDPVSVYAECNFLNNFYCVSLEPSQNDEPIEAEEMTICMSAPVTLTVGGEWVDYLWNTGDTGSSIIIDSDGLYWVELTSEDCYTIRDSIIVSLYAENEVLNLPDTLFRCNDNVVVIDAGNEYESYEWQDGFTESSYTAWSEGTYVLTVKDQCGVEFTDSTHVVQTEIQFNLQDTVFLCPDAQDTILADTGFAHIEAFPSLSQSCTNCNELTISTHDEGWYYLTGYTDAGCLQHDSLFVQVIGEETYYDTIYFCANDSVFYQNEWITQSGDRQYDFACGQMQLVHFSNYFLDIEADADYTCALINEASIDLIVEGVEPFTFEWAYENATSQNLLNIGPGDYPLTVTDGNGCQYYYSFEIPSNQSVFEEIHNIELCDGDSTQIGGNWYADNEILSFHSVECDTNFVYNIVVLNPVSYTVNLQHPCFESSNGSIDIEASGNGHIEYMWGNGLDNQPGQQNLPAGEYNLMIMDEAGCGEAISIMLMDIDAQYFNLPDDYETEAGESILLSLDNDDQASDMYWYPEEYLSCSACFSPIFTSENDAQIFVDIIDINGCTYTLSTFIDVSSSQLYVPNIFTPNQDGINDAFNIGSGEDLNYDIFVYDRWGNLMHQGEGLSTHDHGQSWDGTFEGQPLNSDVYFYIIFLQTPSGEKQISGSVTLIN